MKNRQTIIDECDAGLMKFAVPIFLQGEFVGVAGGCGKLRGQGQVEAYLVHRTTDLDENIVNELAGDIETISEDRLESVINYVETRVDEVIEEYRCSTVEGA
jgi:ligand-binding sensor protein